MSIKTLNTMLLTAVIIGLAEMIATRLIIEQTNRTIAMLLMYLE